MSNRYGEFPFSLRFGRRCARASRRTHDVIEHGIRVSREQRSTIAHSAHLPQIVPVDEISVLVNRFGLEQKCARLKEVALVPTARGEDNPSIGVFDLQFYPALGSCPEVRLD